jgi:hypothetical protein
LFVRLVEFSPSTDAAMQFVQVFEQTVLHMVKAQTGCIGDSALDAERYSRECYPEIETMLRPFLNSDPELHTCEEREPAKARGTCRK